MQLMTGERSDSSVLKAVCAVLAAIWVVLIGNLLISIGLSAPNVMTEEVDLPGFTFPGISLQATLPRRLYSWNTVDQPRIMTLYVESHRPDVAELVLSLTSDDRTVVILDTEGNALSGPLVIPLEYPQQSIVILGIATSATSSGAGALSSHRAPLNVSLLSNGVLEPVKGLDIEVTLASQLRGWLGQLSGVLRRPGIPIMLVVTPLVLLAVWWLLRAQKRTVRERQLASQYVRIRELLDDGRRADAMAVAHALRQQAPWYERLDHLDALLIASTPSGVSGPVAHEDEPADNEALLAKGIAAYKAQDWPQACSYLDQASRLDAYNPHLRFLHRTACLYLELDGRDRGLRIAALGELGSIGDLITLSPLVAALDDANDQVAEAAEDALYAVGPSAFEALVDGLKGSSQIVNCRSQSVLARLGQQVRDQLLSLLQSGDVELVSIASELLIKLGARDQLAEALLTADTRVLEGIVKALVSDELVACAPLLEVLGKATEERQPYVLAAVGELKLHASIDRRIEERLRSIRNGAKRRLYGQALRVRALPYKEGLDFGKQTITRTAEAL